MQSAPHSPPNIRTAPAPSGVWSLADVLARYAAAGLSFEADLAAYAGGHGGYALSRPDLLLFFRPVVKAHLLAGETRWLEAAAPADAWYVHLLVGRVASALHEMPYFLPWCCWHREFRLSGGPLHFRRTEQIIKKLRNHT